MRPANATVQAPDDKVCVLTECRHALGVILFRDPTVLSALACPEMSHGCLRNWGERWMVWPSDSMKLWEFAYRKKYRVVACLSDE